MINPDLLEALSSMNRPMVIFLDEEDDEESELLREMKRHHEEEESRPRLVPYPM